MSKAAILEFNKLKLSRLSYIDKKTQTVKRLSDIIYRDLQYVTRPNDRTKKIALNARNLLTNLLQMILKSPHKEIFVDHNFLSPITEVDSSKQNANLLVQISDIIEATYHNAINFHGKRRTYGYVIKLTKDGHKKAKNPIAFYTNQVEKNIDLGGKKFLPGSKKISTPYISNKENPIEEINSSYAREFISKKEKTYKKEKTNKTNYATCADAFLTAHPQVATNEPIAQIYLTSMTQEITNTENNKMLLSKALWSAFGEQSANIIQDNCEFIELDADTIGIKPGIGITFNDIEKAKIRKCIKLVYGEDVKILAATLKPYANSDCVIKQINQVPIAEELIEPLAMKEIVKTPFSQNKSQWLNFKANVGDRKLREMLNKPTLKVVEIPNKVIIEAHAYLIQEMLSSYLEDLEEAVVQTGLTLEFYEKSITGEYVVKDRKPSVFTVEKILKDRQWKKNVSNGFENFINELKKNRG